jgi:hypothetical protein
VKKLGRCAGSRTPRTSRPADCEPTAIECRQRIGFGFDLGRGRDGRAAGRSARGAAGVPSAGVDRAAGSPGLPWERAATTTALAVTIASAAPSHGRAPQTRDRGSEPILKRLRP